MTNRKARRLKRRNRYRGDEDVNPMNFVSNLSDVMLILAVGIMLALIMHWNVQIEDTSGQTEEKSQEQAVSFSDDDLENLDELPEDMEKTGDVYYDPNTGKYYIIESTD